MTTIGAIGGASSAWSSMAAARGKPAEKMFNKADADGSGGIDTSELQGLLDNVAKKTGVSGTTDAGELLTKLDGNGDGSLSSDELAQGMASILPPPSTMEFAQSRGQGGDNLFSRVDADGNGSISESEMQTLADKRAANGDASTTATTSSDAANSDFFSKLDTNGDGSLSQAEFDAGRPANHAGGGGGHAAGASASASTTYDPLDVNQDGVVSAAERMAGAASTDAVQALFKAIDTNGDGSINQSEGDAFVQQLSSAYESASTTTPTTSSTSSTSSTDSDKASSSVDLQKILAGLMQRHYDEIASAGAQEAATSTLSMLA